jgi:hypothetical protein
MVCLRKVDNFEGPFQLLIIVQSRMIQSRCILVIVSVKKFRGQHLVAIFDIKDNLLSSSETFGWLQSRHEVIGQLTPKDLRSGRKRFLIFRRYLQNQSHIMNALLVFQMRH